jgi:hypothetical protein
MFQVENIWPAGASKKGGRRSSPGLKPEVSAPRTIDELVRELGLTEEDPKMLLVTAEDPLPQVLGWKE